MALSQERKIQVFQFQSVFWINLCQDSYAFQCKKIHVKFSLLINVLESIDALSLLRCRYNRIIRLLYYYCLCYFIGCLSIIFLLPLPPLSFIHSLALFLMYSFFLWTHVHILIFLFLFKFFFRIYSVYNLYGMNVHKNQYK